MKGGKMRIEKCFACGKEFIVKGKHDLYCEDCRERETAKDEATFINMSQEASVNLTCAVLETAGKDYMSAIKKWHNSYDADSRLIAFARLKSLIYWFKSKGFSIWAGELNPTYILLGLNRKAYADKKMKISKYSEVKK